MYAQHNTSGVFDHFSVIISNTARLAEKKVYRKYDVYFIPQRLSEFSAIMFTKVPYARV
jgi:hypothetical protein